MALAVDALRLLFIITTNLILVNSICRNVQSVLNITHVALDTRPDKETIQLFNYDKDLRGYFIGEREDSECLIVNVTYVQVNPHGDNAIYDVRVQEILTGSDFVIGDYFLAVATFAHSIDVQYIVAEPLGILEERQNGQLQNTVTTVWPSYSLLIASVSGNVDFLLSNEGIQKVVIVGYGETENCIRVLDAMKSTLWKASRILKLFRIDATVRELDSEPEMASHHARINDVFGKLRRTLEASDMVVLYMEAPLAEKMRILRVIFSKGADLEEANRTWLIADMTMAYQRGVYEAMADVPVLRSTVYMVKVRLPDIDSEQAHCIDHAIGVKNRGLSVIKSMFEKTVINMTSQTRQAATNSLERFITLECENDTIQKSFNICLYPRNSEVDLFRTKPMEQRLWYYDKTACCGLLRTTWYHKSKLTNNATKSPRRTVFYYNRDYILEGHPAPRENFIALVVEERPFAFQNAKGEFGGVYVDIFQAVLNELYRSKIFLNFTYESVSGYGRKEKGQWSGVLGEMNRRSESYDGNTVIALGMITRTQERAMDFDFSPAVFASYTTYITKRTLHQDMFQFLFPFSKGVWALLFLTMVLSGLYMTLLQKWNPFQYEIPPGVKVPIIEGIWHSFLTLTQVGAPYGLVTIPNRVFSVFLWFFALVIVGSYTGNLTNFLTQSYYETPRYTLERIVAKHYKHVQFGAVRDSIVSELLHRGSNATEVEDSNLVLNYSQGIERVKRGGYVLLGMSPALIYHQNHDEECILAVDHRSMFKRDHYDIAFPMIRSWRFAADFKTAMSRLIQRGEIQTIVKKWIILDAHCVAESTLEQSKLDIHTSAGLYVVLTVAAGLSFACLGVKLIMLKLGGDNVFDTAEEPSTNETETDGLELGTVSAPETRV